MKLHLPMAVSASFLAWGMLEFRDSYISAGQLGYARTQLRVAVDYLMRCHTAEYEFVGQIAEPGADHGYWGRPEEQTGPRTAYIWTKSTPASDLLGATSAALASASLVFNSTDAQFSADLLRHARQLYAWGASVEGKYSTTHKEATYLYSSSRYLDKLMLAAAWLHQATGM